MATAISDQELSPPSSNAGDEDEGLIKWKKAIRDQVEEDLEYQVQLRLQIHSLYYKQRSKTINPCLLKLKKHVATAQESSVKTTSRLQSTYSHPQRDVKPIVYKHPEMSELNQVVGSVQAIPDQFIPSPIKRKLAVHVAEKFEEHGDKHVHTTQESLKGITKEPGIFNYVHSKYGTPRTQLQSLSENGSYETTTIDSSGVGSGPMLNYPVEALVCLPTPRHNFGSNPSCDQEENNTSVAPPTSRISKSVYATGHETDQEVIGQGLQFESRFESGNLAQAIRFTSQEYILQMSPDLYSKRHTQWFYFRIKGMVSKKAYIFHIANFYKPGSLYNYGMQPLLYSEAVAEQGENGWKRVGYNISYHKTSTRHCKALAQEHLDLYTLTWTMEFPCSEDTCYIAHCYPYSYSKLLSHLIKLEECPKRSCYFSKETLCHTLAGNCCPLLTITNFEEPEEKPRMGVVITARVHPGETNSSWIMQGLIDFLISDSAHAKTLRSHYVFKLVPMLNPDGVIVGNYRTSLAAVDLNRVYKSPQVNLFPTIHYTKAMIETFMKERQLLLYVDLHGHSRKPNIFMYGCHVPHCDHLQLLQERVIPFLLSQQAPQMFDLGSCKFSVQRCKEATGRVVTWKMGVPNSFTMESTFYGSTLEDTKRHFSTKDLLCMGRKLAEVTHYYHNYIESETYKLQVQSQIAESMMVKTVGRTISRGELPAISKSSKDPRWKSKRKLHASSILNKFMKTDPSILEQESSTSGSDSEDDEFSWKTKKVSRRKRKTIRDLQRNKTCVELPQVVKPAKHLKLPPKLCSHTGTSYSAPTRLPFDSRTGSNIKSTLPSSWRFVSKYQNRSNGGIPMFSEERLQERKEKLLQSQSMVHSSEPGTIASHLKNFNTTQLWQRHLVPTTESSEFHYKSAHTTDHNQRSIMPFKLSPQLTKYITDIWKS